MQFAFSPKSLSKINELVVFEFTIGLSLTYACVTAVGNFIVYNFY